MPFVIMRSIFPFPVLQLCLTAKPVRVGTGCIGTGSDMTVKSRQAQTKLAINLLTKKIPKGKRSKVWLYFAQRFKHRDVQEMQQNNCVERGERRQESTADQQLRTEK